MTKYRSDIDGIRAIAIILVILFHLGLSRFGTGGYIGVDVFFVISGYLITGHLRKDLKENINGIFEFYRRRVIRIFPALFVVYLFCIICEISVKFASQLSTFQHLLLSSTFFGSNFYLYKTTGYFDFLARGNPLIHTWSLSIEEQFYIFLPLLLYVFRNASIRWQLGWLIIFTLASLTASQAFVSTDTAASFYLMPLRAWELMAGSLLSYRSHRPLQISRWSSEVLGVMGLLLILYSASRLNAQTHFPGFAAIPAVLGSVFLLTPIEIKTTLVQQILACGPMRFVGKISYSLYLWHWPLIVYARYLHPIETISDKLALIAVSVVVATLSWWLIEQPIRKRGRNISTQLALSVAGVAMVTMAVIAEAMPAVHRLVWKPNAQAEQILARANQDESRQSWRLGRCFLDTNDIGRRGFASECLAIDPKRRNVLVIGDSHAGMIWWGLHRKFTEVNFLQATAASCEPLNHYKSASCQKLMDSVIDNFLPSHKIDAIIVSLSWRPGDEKQIKGLIEHLKRGTDKVIVFGPNRWYVLPFPEVAARAVYSGKPDAIARYEQSGPMTIDYRLGNAVTQAGATYISVYRLMCSKGCWVLGRGGVPVTFDYDHLSLAGSEMLAAALPPKLYEQDSIVMPLEKVRNK